VAAAVTRMNCFRNVVARLPCELARAVVKDPAGAVFRLVNRESVTLEHQDYRYPVGPGGLYCFDRAPDRDWDNLAPSLYDQSVCTRLLHRRRAMGSLAGCKSPVPANRGQWIVVAARFAVDAVVGQY
jgi:hypothetical protein